jgi:hypothetical protein
VDWESAPKGPATASLRVESPTESAVVSVALDAAFAPHDVATPRAGRIALEAEDGIRRQTRGSAPGWRRLDGVGWNGSVALLEPRTLSSLDELDALPGDAPALQLRFAVPEATAARLDFHALPTHPPYEGRRLRCAIALDSNAPQWLEFPADDEWGPLWSERVLRARMTESLGVQLAAGVHELTVYGTDPSLVLDAVDVVIGDGR